MPFARDDQDRRVLALALPALGTLAAEPLYVLADTAIVGHLGTAPLAGLALAASVLLLVTAGCNFLAYATTQQLAHHRGAGRPREAAAVGVQALWLCVLIGVPIALAVAALAQPLAWLLGGRGDVLTNATTYLEISSLGVPFVLVALVGQGVLRGVEDLRTPLVIVLVANLVNLVLEVIAVYGLDLGIAGSAWSTVLVQGGAAVAFLVVLRRHVAAARSRRVEWTQLAPFLVAGRHLAMRVAAMLFVLTAATFIAARIDEPTLAAHQIAATIFTFLALVADAYAIPAQTLVASALGGGDGDGAIEVGGRVVRMAMITAVVLAVALAVAAWPLAHLFSSDSAVVARATVALILLGLLQPAAGMAMSLDGVLIGGADYRFLAKTAGVSALAFLPLAALTLAVPALGIAGVWSAMVMWMVARAVLNQRRFVSGAWSSSVEVRPADTSVAGTAPGAVSQSYVATTDHRPRSRTARWARPSSVSTWKREQHR
jgi:putative MATE family efflux protein